MIEIIAVGAGGFIGAASRYLLGRAVGKLWRWDFPMGTFLVNMIGSFALGLVVACPSLIGPSLDGTVRAALGAGFLGSFTTYSTLMYESFALGTQRKTWLGLFYVFTSIVAGLLLAWLAISVNNLL